MHKLIAIGDHTVDVCGTPGDPYFEALPATLRPSDSLEILFAAEHLTSDAIVLDIGANIGLTTAAFASFAPEGHVYSFEPSPTAFPYLEETVRTNGFSNVTLHQLGLGSTVGELDFFDDPNSATASHLVTNATAGSGTRVRVAVDTVDRVVERIGLDRLDLLKIDVEGFDFDVVEGARSTIEELQPVCIVEFNSFTLQAYGNQNPRGAVEVLLRVFDSVYFRRRSSGDLVQIDDDHLVEFLHMNLAGNGCVDDLICFSRSDGMASQMAAAMSSASSEIAESASIADDAEVVRQRANDLTRELAEERERRESAELRVSDLESSTSDVTRELAEERERRESAELRVSDLESSTSWWLTAPLRSISRAILRRR